MRAGQPLQEEPEGERPPHLVSHPPKPLGSWGGVLMAAPRPRVLQVELLITFEVNNMALDTREVLVWLDLST